MRSDSLKGSPARPRRRGEGAGGQLGGGERDAHERHRRRAGEQRVAAAELARREAQLEGERLSAALERERFER